ncbi:MAG: cyclic nucleotide-binding domain-containing protein [bacterium]
MMFSKWKEKIVSFVKRSMHRILDEDLEKVEVLNKVKLFEYCRGQDLLEIAAECEFREVKEGEAVIEKGSDGDGLYMLDSARLAVVLEEGEEPVAVLEEGDYCGEMSLLDNQPRSANVVCITGGRLLFFSKKGFLKLIQKKSESSFRFLFVQARTLSQRLRDTNRKLSEKL